MIPNISHAGLNYLSKNCASKSKSIINAVVSNGHCSIPVAALGTYKMDMSKLSMRVDVFDTAKAYNNEEELGLKLRNFPEAIVITKLFDKNLAHLPEIRQAVKDSNQKLGRVPDFILIHGPYDIPMFSALRELEFLRNEGYLKMWGVSNFDVEHLEFLIKEGFKPVLNQVEYHPYFQRPQLLEFCKKHNIILQAYRPIAEGKVLEDPVIKAIAEHHQTSPASVIYTWLAQQGMAIVTKVSSEEHLNQYVQSGTFELSSEEIHAISGLNRNGRTATKGGWLMPFTESIKDKWLGKCEINDNVSYTT